jgi:7-carboxy-7-deazaguanine synthase
VNLRVVECFGPTVQGEGPWQGQTANFVRLAGCNLRCSFCGTTYARSESAGEEVSDRVLMNWLTRNDGLDNYTPRVVFTGGEPLMQAQALEEFLDAHPGLKPVGIETNGTIIPSTTLMSLIDVWVVSPKKGAEDFGVLNSMLHVGWLSDRVHLKFVVDGLDDIDWIADFQSRLDRPAPIWIQPKGTTQEEILRGGKQWVEAAVARGWNLSLRLHVLLWGNERGR